MSAWTRREFIKTGAAGFAHNQPDRGPYDPACPDCRAHTGTHHDNPTSGDCRAENPSDTDVRTVSAGHAIHQPNARAARPHAAARRRPELADLPERSGRLQRGLSAQVASD